MTANRNQFSSNATQPKRIYNLYIPLLSLFVDKFTTGLAWWRHLQVLTERMNGHWWYDPQTVRLRNVSPSFQPNNTTLFIAYNIGVYLDNTIFLVNGLII